MKIDLAKTALSNLVALILNDNAGTTLEERQFTAAAPVAIAEPVEGRNTSVELTAVTGEGYRGSVAFNYTRLALDGEVETTPTEFSVEETDVEADVATALINQLKLLESEVQSTDFVAPVVDVDGNQESAGSITLVAKEGSFLYVGTLTIVLNAKLDPTLEDTFTVTDLTGFEGFAG